ncbi:nicotinamide mononucleotide transporter family protein [Sphingomonas sp. 28-63-12]|uniref:nicotinamide riboside transporter PnuC n=1 Tax=Sphingomonas sp. 28-63-12 TaxID=1970434 RepID=UPI000BC56316|nr:MAG: nicotinamide mononucleotide transporter [Sphingomonas sp. 28-63-12]
MSTLELIAFVLGVINVALVVRRSIWNYPFGLVMVVLYGRVFFDAKLYSDTLLQAFFFVVQLYGWWAWSRASASAGTVLVDRLDGRARLGWAAGCAVAIVAWSSLVSRYTDASLPWWDASAAILSVAAQIMMSRRLIENWVLWIAVDILSIGLYAAKGLWLTMLLYAVFLALAIWGLIGWRRDAAAQVAAV